MTDVTRFIGKQKIKELGIAAIYDLRSDVEIEKYQTPCPTIEGVDVIRVPVFKLEDYSPEMMAKWVQVRFTLLLRLYSPTDSRLKQEI